MEKAAPMELIKIKKIAADIREFPAKIDSVELANNARHLLRKYALLSEKIERNVLIGASHHKALATIRTSEFKAVRHALKEKANSILHANNKKVQSEKLAKAPVKKTTPKKASKPVDVKAAKETDSKKTVKKSAAKPRKAATPKQEV